jgi:hypothetical protein
MFGSIGVIPSMMENGPVTNGLVNAETVQKDALSLVAWFTMVLLDATHKPWQMDAAEETTQTKRRSNHRVTNTIFVTMGRSEEALKTRTLDAATYSLTKPMPIVIVMDFGGPNL